jgi:spore coat polysaccharide biosynthesis protein SpsF
LQRTFPRGLDTEIFTFAALELAAREAREPYDREHVTPYLYKHADRFRLRSFIGAADLSRYRWTVDTVEDWQFMEAVHERLLERNQPVTTEAVLKLLKEQPDLIKLNAHVEQKKPA